MNTVCTLQRANIYRTIRNLRSDVDALQVAIDGSTDTNVRGPLKARQYVIELEIEALQEKLRDN